MTKREFPSQTVQVFIMFQGSMPLEPLSAQAFCPRLIQVPAYFIPDALLLEKCMKNLMLPRTN